jgi:hypothetical protein
MNDVQEADSMIDDEQGSFPTQKPATNQTSASVAAVLRSLQGWWADWPPTGTRELGPSR